MDGILCTRRHLLRVTALAALGGCAASDGLDIVAVDDESNRYLLSPDLDARLYSTREPMQYFLVSGFDGVSARQAQATIDAFVRDKYSSDEVAHADRLGILFYRKSWFSSYEDGVHEAARSEFGYLPDHSGMLAAQVRLERVAGRRDEWRRHRTQYTKKQKRLAVSDMIDTVHLFGR